MRYVNWVGVTVLVIVVLIMKIILRSGGSSFSQRYDVGIGSQHSPSDANKYAVDATIFGITVLGVVLLIFNGIRSIDYTKFNWEWLSATNWIFMSIYFAIAFYGMAKMILNVRKDKSIL